ncbi:nitrogenase cofactor biosynthesis protein NifB [Nitrincola sp. A-D6]|uniref:nitrogenase cofactor biosynthesis protein NifB n=1 Tax=Nitrincola sp. A-D6 TaxID=1545442 RepID=UPI000AEE2114|nr:nitrogenase cofactor biosynthesis protein NifB [Nitrincola sp. A-D6]
MKLPVLNNTPATSEAGGCASGSCGSSDASVQSLPESIRAKVADHPCFSEQAHHFFARMHVAVAPACNIQCNYCNRKYDCSNESRPGVVSEVLTPQQAVKKVKAVAAAIPQMSVLGIAGPGDPLANPHKTFETFRRLSAETPDIKLCVSTNGLTLPECVDELCQHNIDHVTVTINCVDPEIGAKIYPWIFWKNKRIRGVEAARILIEQQQKGLQMLIDRGILVKVNSVLIPGINDQHLIEVSRIVKEKGAFLHNVMPIISEPEHGTYFGLTGQAEPTAAELQAVQDACAGDMNMMRHCRQCRADAVGLLGEDRGAEFTLDKIDAMEVDYEAAMVKRAEVHEQLLGQLYAQRESASQPARTALQGRTVLMAVSTKGGGLINQHFGHATEFLVYEASDNGVRFIGHRQVDKPYCEGGSSCGEDAETLLDTLLKSLQGCEVLLCSKVGYEPGVRWSRRVSSPMVSMPWSRLKMPFWRYTRRC